MRSGERAPTAVAPADGSAPNDSRDARGSRRGARAAAIVTIVGLGLGLVAACQPPQPSPPPSASTSAPATLPSSSPPAGGVTVDPSLLEILPADVAGVPIEPAPEAASEIALDPTLVTDVEAIAVALAVSPGTSGAEDLVIANVVRLRQDVFNEAFFRGWRDTYDAAACERAGGVLGNAEAEMDGRQVFIGTCVNGGFTYHVRYGEDVIVSLTSVGERRFGELLVKNLGN